MIFDRKGVPSLRLVRDTYLASCKRSIYAGYVEQDKVHDFNGNQRGWLSEGVLRDLHGKCVGFMKSANGKQNPAFPPFKVSRGFAELPKPPLKPASQEQPFFYPVFKKEWADKTPAILMIP